MAEYLPGLQPVLDLWRGLDFGRPELPVGIVIGLLVMLVTMTVQRWLENEQRLREQWRDHGPG